MLVHQRVYQRFFHPLKQRYSELTKRCESETSSPVQRDTGGSCLDAQGLSAAGSSLHSSHIGIIYAYYIYIYNL